MLNKSNLTPRERILTIIKNDAHYRVTGKKILSDTEIQSISDNWHAKNNHDVNEYNKYWHMWDTFKYFEIDMQTLVNSIQIDYLNFEKIILLYYFQKEPSTISEIMQERFLEEYKNALPCILENTGLDYNKTIHTYTFLSLSQNIQENILTLDESAKWESKYFDDEEILSKFLKDKKNLSSHEIEKLSNRVIDSLSWDKIRSESREKDISHFILFDYFANYPIIEFAKKLADNLDILYKDESDLKEKISNIKGLRKKLKDVVYEEIERGLFFEEYIPLCNENSHETYNGKISLKLKDIFNIWVKEKNKTRAMFKKMIDEGELVIEEKTQKVFNFTITEKVITGNSLYSSSKNLSFIFEYKKQVESLVFYGFLYNLLEKENIPKKYGYILAYQDIIKKVSNIVGMQVTDMDEKYLKHIESLAENTNLYLMSIDDSISDLIYEGSKWNFTTETFFEKFKVNLSETKPVKTTPHELLNKEAKRLLGFEWS